MRVQGNQLVVYISFVLATTLAQCNAGDINYKITNANASKGPPVITEGNNSTIIVHPRDNVELSCPYKSTTFMVYEWYKEPSKETITELWERFDLTSPGYLKIRPVTHEDSGTYICKAVNGFGMKSSSIKLAVTGEDPFKDNLLKSSTSKRSNSNTSVSSPEINRELLPKSRSINITKGSLFQLRCEAKGNPKPNITLYKNDIIVGESGSGSRDSLSNVCALKISSMTEKDGGRYRCESVNIYGKDMYEVIINVTGSWYKGDEILELNPSNLTLSAGGNGSITCVARFESEFEPWFVWLKKVENAPANHPHRVMDNTNTNTNSSDTGKVYYHDGVYYRVLGRTKPIFKHKHVYSTEFNLTTVSNNDAGVYYCVVAGRMGFNLSEARVFVEADPLEVAKTTMKQQKDAAVKWAILWIFAFLIIAVLLIFVKLYGCKISLKKRSTSVSKKDVISSKASALNKQNDAFQPLFQRSSFSSFSGKSDARLGYDISIHSNTGAADSECCGCSRYNSPYHHNANAQCCHDQPMPYNFKRSHRQNPCRTLNLGSTSSHEYTFPLPYPHEIPPPSSESNFYEPRRIFHPNQRHYYYHHLRHSKSSDVGSLE